MSESRLSCDSSGLTTFIVLADNSCCHFAVISSMDLAVLVEGVVELSLSAMDLAFLAMISSMDLAVFVGGVGELSLLGSP